MGDLWQGKLVKIDNVTWRIPKDSKAGMRVDGIIFANDALIDDILRDNALEQVANVAALPGIVKNSIAMPDIHWGYGFPIGGVAAMSYSDGVISPGGVGYDINCGVRMIRTDVDIDEISGIVYDLVAAMFAEVPSGLGSKGRMYLNESDLMKVMNKGGKWAVSQGYGWDEDIDATEENGFLDIADPDAVSEKAIKRGLSQVGTLGSGNHFLEIQSVEEIYEPDAAEAFGINRVGQITLMIHSGSRGLGYQICDDYLAVMQKAMRKYDIPVPDKQLACAPITSPEGQQYLAAMACAANYAWANRQAMAHWTRDVFSYVLKRSPRDLGMRQVYDVAHNIAKIEEHNVNGKNMKVVVHRKGATRAFGPHGTHIPKAYRSIGQPVIVPGDMGRYSYLMVGTDDAMRLSFGSSCHGAGRVLSRKAAMSASKGADIRRELEEKGIVVMAANKGTLAEEASDAYKDVSHVVQTVHDAGIARKVAKMRPVGVIKG